MAFIELGIPAWKDDYTRVADLRADWAAGKEFVFHEGVGLNFSARYGQATTRAELKELAPGASVVIRYKQNRELATVKL